VWANRVVDVRATAGVGVHWRAGVGHFGRSARAGVSVVDGVSRELGRYNSAPASVRDPLL